VEGDDWMLLTEDDPACCSRWRQACRLRSPHWWPFGVPAIYAASAGKRRLLLEECLLSLLVSDAVADEAKNGGTLVGRCCSFFFFSVSRVAGRERRLLLVLPLRLRKGVASAGSVTAAEERCGCGGGYSWASSSARFWLLSV
jgi:hypothetical protein